jgi:hypothetical protein
LSSESSDSNSSNEQAAPACCVPACLHCGKKKWEYLKKKWFKAKEKDQQEHTQSQQAVIGEELGSTKSSGSD